MRKNKKIEDLIKKVKEYAIEIYKELGNGWSEQIYQKAMEVILRENKIEYESQRILPVNFKGYVVGEGKPDLIIWVNTGKKRVAIVIDLKSTQKIEEEHIVQVKRYIQELKKQLKNNEEVYPIGFVFDFTSPSKRKIKENVEEREGFKIVKVK